MNSVVSEFLNTLPKRDRLTVIDARNVTEAVNSALKACLSSEQRPAPRGQPTRERTSALIRIQYPYDNIYINPVRKLNYSFMVAEWLWMTSGMNNADLILPFNSKLGMALDDEKLVFNGAYGPQITEQLEYVIAQLKGDSASRQAIISIWRPRPAKSADIPCTLDFQFLLRGNELHMTTHMRSNDVWLGLPYDLFNFTQIQWFIAQLLGVQVGTYTHFVGSLHLYERNVEDAVKVLGNEANVTKFIRENHVVYEIPSTATQTELIQLFVEAVAVKRSSFAQQTTAVKELCDRHPRYRHLIALLFGAPVLVKDHTVYHVALKPEAYGLIP